MGRMPVMPCGALFDSSVTNVDRRVAATGVCHSNHQWLRIDAGTNGTNIVLTCTAVLLMSGQSFWYVVNRLACLGFARYSGR
jgi:hypothetical protein